VETTTMPVAVHKAQIGLMKGESVGQFTRALGDAAKVALKKKLNLLEGADVWPIEVFTDKVVLDLYEPKKAARYFGMKYTRKDNGDFEFGETVELRRMVTFEPKNNTMSVTKTMSTAKGGCNGCKSFEGCTMAEKNTAKGCGQYKKTLKWAGDWEQTAKNFWSGVL